MLRANKQSGFTLVELIIVVIILGILAAIAVPKFTSLTSEAEKSACIANQHALEAALQMYWVAQLNSSGTGAYTTTISDLDAYFTASAPTTCPDGTSTYSLSGGAASCSNAAHAR